MIAGWVLEKLFFVACLIGLVRGLIWLNAGPKRTGTEREGSPRPRRRGRRIRA